MTEEGKVVKINDDTKKAIVRFDRKDACANCNACGAFKPDSPHIEFEVDNTLNAKVDDIVSIDIKGMNGLKISLIVYFIPLFNALMGMFIAMLFQTKYDFADYYLMIIFVVMLGVGFGIVKLFDYYFTKNKKIKPLMISIINDKGE